MSAGETLAEKLVDLSGDLDIYERFNLHLLLSVAVGGLAPTGTVPIDGDRGAAWAAGVRTLSRLAPAGLAYVGRPDFVDDQLLRALRSEAMAQEALAHRTGPQELAPGASVATKLSSDPRLVSHVADLLGQRVQPTGISSYLYYNRDGDHLYPHVDTEIFAVNCIIMLEHSAIMRDMASSLIVFSPGGQLERVPLEIGEMAVLRASGTVHGREAVKGEERVVILTVGLEAVDDVPFSPDHL
jgi:hypothetical protein